MLIVLILALVLHVLSAVFWAGSTFAGAAEEVPLVCVIVPRYA